MTKLVVVMVNWNTREMTRECLQTLFTELDGMESEVWMVDNASADNSVAMFKKDFPRIHLIENRENLGFARANNQILRQALGDYYLLLNTDTLIPPGALKGLLEFMDANPGAGAAGPRLRNRAGVVERPLKPLPTFSGEIRYCLAMHCYPLNGLFRWILRRRHDGWQALTQPTKAEVLSAACLIIRRDIIDKVGLLAEDYFLFSEENDYFYRMRQLGFEGYYLPHLEVIHLIGASRKKRGRIDSEANFLKSRLLFFRKFHSRQLPYLKLAYLVFLIWSYLWAGLRRLIRGRRDEDDFMLYGRLLKTIGEAVRA